MPITVVHRVGFGTQADLEVVNATAECATVIVSTEVASAGVSGPVSVFADVAAVTVTANNAAPTTSGNTTYNVVNTAELATALAAAARGDTINLTGDVEYDIQLSGVTPSGSSGYVTIVGNLVLATQQIKGGSGASTSATRPKMTSCSRFKFQAVRIHHFNLVGCTDVVFTACTEVGNLRLYHSSSITWTGGEIAGSVGAGIYISAASSNAAQTTFSARCADILIERANIHALGGNAIEAVGFDGLIIRWNNFSDISSYKYSGNTTSGRGTSNGVQVLEGTGLEMYGNFLTDIEWYPIAIQPTNAINWITSPAVADAHIYQNVINRAGTSYVPGASTAGGRCIIQNAETVKVSQNTFTAMDSASVVFTTDTATAPSGYVPGDADYMFVNNVFQWAYTGTGFSGAAVVPSVWLGNVQSTDRGASSLDNYMWTAAADTDHHQDVIGETVGASVPFGNRETTWSYPGLLEGAFAPTTGSSASGLSGIGASGGEVAASAFAPGVLQTDDVNGEEYLPRDIGAVAAVDAPAPLGSIAPYFFNTGDQIVTVPDGVYFADTITNAVHATTAGTYDGWLVLEAETQGGVIIDMGYPGATIPEGGNANGDLIFAGTTSRILMVGFTFRNGIIKTGSCDHIKFWYCDATYPISTWATEPNWPQHPSVGPFMYHEAPRLLKVSSGSRNIEDYGCDWHDTGTALYQDGGNNDDRITQGAKIWDISEGPVDNVGTNLDPNDILHPTGVSGIVGAYDRRQLLDSYIRPNNTTPPSGINDGISSLRFIAGIGDILDFEIRRTWFEDAYAGISFQSFAAAAYDITGTIEDVWVWNMTGYNRNITVDGTSGQNWDLDTSRINITRINYNETAPGGSDPATVWRTTNPYNSWATYLASRWT